VQNLSKRKMMLKSLNCLKHGNLCRVYTCRFDNQVQNGKLVKKYFFVVKLAQYFL